MSIVERKSHQNISYVERERIENRQKIICSYNFGQYCIYLFIFSSLIHVIVSIRPGGVINELEFSFFRIFVNW
jgi:hypothetical protein